MSYYLLIRVISAQNFAAILMGQEHIEGAIHSGHVLNFYDLNIFPFCHALKIFYGKIYSKTSSWFILALFERRNMCICKTKQGMWKVKHIPKM